MMRQVGREVLLVSCKAQDAVLDKMVPLGLLWFASTLEEAGSEVQVFDFDVAETSFAELLASFRPDVIGLSGTSHSRFDSFGLAKEAKELLPEVCVVYGGCHASFTAENTLEHVPDIDCVVRGEGELTMLEIVEHVAEGNRDFSDVLGASCRKDGAILHNAARPRIRDLDSLPLPARHLVDWKHYELNMYVKNIPGGSVMSSRGCPIDCSFCSASAMFTRRVTFRSAEKVLDEVEILLNEYKVEAIKFFDSTFTIKRRHAEAICDEFVKRGLSHIPWECEIRVDSVSYELLEKMRDAGCYFVEFGVESASPKVLETMHKQINLEQVERVAGWLKELGIHSLAFFTYGHIGETAEDAAVTMAFVEKLRPKVTYIGGGVGIRIYPGTQVERHAVAEGLLPDDFHSWAEPFNDPQNRFLDSPTDIPLLLQPQMQREDLMKIREQVLLKKMFSPRAVWEKLTEIRSPREVVKLGYYVMKIVSRKLRPKSSKSSKSTVKA